MRTTKNILILFLFFAGIAHLNAQTATEIDKANQLDKSVFLVAYTTDGAEADKAFSIANNAKKSLESNSVVIKMKTTEAANSTLVSKYRLAGAPLPLILVLDKNGTTAGGLILSDATAEKLVDMIPSPKTSELIKALSEGQSVYVVVYKESMTSKKDVIDNCASACRKMKNNSVTVVVEMDDKNEAKLLQTLKCDLTSSEPTTYVLNKSGQIAGTFTGLTDVKTLMSTAEKTAAGGCCPDGAKKDGCQ